jgi:catechol-2,3-dioxygenase
MLIQELTLYTADVAAQAAFYREVLRLPTEESTGRVQVTAGRTRMIFTHQPGWQGIYHFAFDVPENQLDAACDWLNGRADFLTLNGESRFHSDNWNADMVYFEDSAGNILEFIARHNQPNASQHAFSERSLLAVTEIGLGTRDVRSTVGQLMAELGQRTYDGGGSSTFSAVGDEDGLFIVVHHERPWFPETGQPGGLYPFTARLAQPNTIVQVNNGVIRINAVPAATHPFEAI